MILFQFSILDSEKPLPGNLLRAAEQREEIAPSQWIELHPMPASQLGLQAIEMAGVSQELTERFYNPPSVAKLS
jgi:hypothetical protein